MFELVVIQREDRLHLDVHVEMETILTLYHNKLKHGVTVKKRFATGGF